MCSYNKLCTSPSCFRVSSYQPLPMFPMLRSLLHWCNLTTVPLKGSEDGFCLHLHLCPTRRPVSNWRAGPMPAATAEVTTDLTPAARWEYWQWWQMGVTPSETLDGTRCVLSLPGNLYFAFARKSQPDDGSVLCPRGSFYLLFAFAAEVLKLSRWF